MPMTWSLLRARGRRSAERFPDSKGASLWSLAAAADTRRPPCPAHSRLLVRTHASSAGLSPAGPASPTAAAGNVRRNFRTAGLPAAGWSGGAAFMICW